MTELAVTMEQLIEAVKQVSTKLDKLQDEKVQSLSERIAVMDERLSSTQATAKAAKEETAEVATLKEKVAKLERVVYGLMSLIAAEVIGVVIWLLKK